MISGGGRLVPQLESEGSNHILWTVGEKSLKTFQYLLPLRKILLREKVDILHLRSRVPAWIGYLAWKSIPKMRRPRLVTTVHGYYSVHFFSGIMTRGERVIAVSNSIMKYISENYPKTDPNHIRVIHRGIDPSAFPYGYTPPKDWLENWYRSFPQLNGKYVICIIGRITRLKGHLFFIELIKRLLDKGFPVHGLVIGGMEEARLGYSQELRQKVNELHITEKITFAGYHSQVKEIVASVNLVVSLSQKPESFGRSALEAMGMGIPVVGFQHGGVGELLRNLFPKGLIKVNNLDHATEVITNIYQTKPFPGKNERFTLDKMCHKTLELYNELLESSP